MALLIFKKPSTVNRALFSRVYKELFPPAYALSVIFTSPKEMQKLNLRYRKKNTPTDVLSFPLGKNSGELYLCMSEVRYRSRAFGMPPDAYLPFLTVHGALHLKGHDHGRVMERLEEKYCRSLKLPHPKEFK